MIPIKDKKYLITFKGYWGSYVGEGVCTGEKEDFCGHDGDTFTYGFKLPLDEETCFFLETDIVAEFSNGEEVRPLICDPENYPEDSIVCQEIQSQIDSENDYCETCDSCGETGCCPPINCEAVRCKYGEINLKDYRCFQDQWGVMYEALKDIVEECGEEHIGNIANDALKAVDKLWDKLYSKE